MDFNLFIQYGGVLLVLVALEGILAADNALVLAVLVKDLPKELQKKALFYGLLGAFIFRFGALFVISYLANVWQVQAVGAVYLMFIAVNFMLKKFVFKPKEKAVHELKATPNFWMTVLKVELADVAFAIDSILAGVALAITLPETGYFHVGGMDIGPFVVVFLGGFIGIVLMRFAAKYFVSLLEKRPGLETAAFGIVGWVGVKLAIVTLAHPAVDIISEAFAHSILWEVIFYGVLILIAVVGWFTSKEVAVVENNVTKEV